VARLAGRPAGPRFGDLVHRVLRDVPLAAERVVVDRLARAHGRALMAPPGEVAAAGEAVARALAHPVLRRAAAAPEVRRELPLCIRRDDGSLLEGVIDLLFREGAAADARWVVVDFKTDAEGEAAERYRTQLGWYAWAVGRMTGAPASAILMRV
jgi:ATP-dependent exoDNAse (exonuclease V) beta subunit